MKSEWTPYRFKDDKFERLNKEQFIQKTIRELVNNPYVLRIIDHDNRIYYVGTDEPYLKLMAEGKDPKWLHDFFEEIRLDFIEQGLPPSKSIYDWSIETIFAHQAALTTFPGVEVLSEEEVHAMNAKGYFDPSEWAQEQMREPGEEG